MSQNQRPIEVNKHTSIQELFFRYKLQAQLIDSDVFIYSAYFLNIFNIINKSMVPVAIDYLLVKKTLQVSSSYSKKIIHFHQKLLSKLSCDFILNLLKELPEKKDLQIILPLFYLKSDEGRMALPCLPITEIILLHMIKNRSFLIILIRRKDKSFAIAYRGNPDKNDFELVNNLPRNCATLVMIGTSEDKYITTNIIAMSDGMSIKNLILYNNAAHPQYSGKILLHYRHNPYAAYLNLELAFENNHLIRSLARELDSKISMANILGCTQNNQRLFYLEHIYCSNTSRINNICNHTTQKEFLK